ncbi:MAG TPA: sugar ABC transporter permease [Chloroflexi bacterium]|nr:sugar ABC transporter permease [Chloroflexota bacterium]
MEQITQIREVLPSWRSLRNMQPRAKRDFKLGMLFISPWLIGFLAFTLIPMVATFIFTFLNLRITDGLLNPLTFVGLQNYKLMFSDPQTWTSLWITVKFGLMALPIGIFMPLLLALLMNNPALKGQNFFRSMFYMPYIIPFVAAIFLWGGMLNPETGWINRALTSMGVQNPPGWGNDVFWVYPTYIIMGIWGIGNAMLIMLAGLQGVPTELYDAAEVDGAGGWATFWNVTFPMISPVIFYNLVLSIVGLFQFFLLPLVVNSGTGRPGGATLFYNVILYKTFFTYQNMSYGATLAWLLFAVILVVTVVLFATAKYWVYYASESR